MNRARVCWFSLATCTMLGAAGIAACASSSPSGSAASSDGGAPADNTTSGGGDAPNSVDVIGGTDAGASPTADACRLCSTRPQPACAVRTAVTVVCTSPAPPGSTAASNRRRRGGFPRARPPASAPTPKRTGRVRIPRSAETRRRVAARGPSSSSLSAAFCELVDSTERRARRVACPRSSSCANSRPSAPTDRRASPRRREVDRSASADPEALSRCYDGPR
jgi:hypothetical protein